MVAAPSVPVARQFVQVGARRVLLRHAGQGPAVLLIHQSPRCLVTAHQHRAPVLACGLVRSDPNAFLVQKIAGIDLVLEQLRVASGAPLSIAQEDVTDGTAANSAAGDNLTF